MCRPDSSAIQEDYDEYVEEIEDEYDIDGLVIYSAELEVPEEYEDIFDNIAIIDGKDVIYMTKDNGEYKIIPSRQAEECPIRFAQFGWRVQYIRKDGMNFLAVRKPSGETMWTMVLTPDNEDNCYGQQQTLEKANWEDVVNNTLLNTPYLWNIPREQLRLMRNEILARHGYVFQSKDLRDYFSKKWWYKPAANNNAVKLNVIEQTNVELIKSEEAVEPGLHPADVAGDVDQSDFE